MQKELNNYTSLCVNRDRGSNGVVPFLLIFLAVLLFGMALMLSGCGESKEDLMLLDEMVSDTAGAGGDLSEDEYSDLKGENNREYNGENNGRNKSGNNSKNNNEGKNAVDITHKAQESPSSDLNGSSSAAAEEKIYVYICGAVANPDVYELDSDKHVVDGIRAAGGFLEDADRNAINLAARISDGMKIYVTVTGESEDSIIKNTQENSRYITTEAPQGSSNSGQAAGGLVDINSASKEQLMTLPGIGEGKASKIVEYRENNGPFSQNSDIMNVNGIKNGAYEKIKDLICVG